MLTTDDALQQRLEAARARERQARASAARIRREMLTLNRRRETQLLCTLGRAWLALGERSPGFKETSQRFLESYISRGADRDVLVGTPWQLTGPHHPGAEFVADE